jgi:transposase
MVVMERRYALRDDQWQRLEALGLPGGRAHVGVTARDNRLFVEAVLYRFRAGIPWRDLPERFGNWHRVYVRFNRWSKTGIWQKVFAQLAKEPNNEYALIDSTIVRAHRSAAGARKKGQTKSSTTRRSASVSDAAEAG